MTKRGGTERGGTANRISGGTVNGPAIQAENIGSVEAHVHHHWTSPPAPAEPAAEPGAWVREVADSPLWRALPEGSDASGTALSAACDIAATLAVLHDEAERALVGVAERASADPWWDRSFGSRFHGQICQLVCAESGPDWELRPAEALLLTLAPYLSQTLWVRTAAARVHVGPTDLRLTRARGDRADFEKFFDRGHERLVRRATLNLPERPGAESDIGWWLFHQWIDHGLRGTEDHWTAYDALVARLPLADQTSTALFHRRRAGQLLYGLRLPLGETNGPERLARVESVASVPGGTALPQRVRLRRLSMLLSLARARALDLPALPDDLVENLGVPHRVDLADLRRTVADAAWHSDNGPMVLQAADCHHEAVAEALRRHVSQVDNLLYDIHRAARGDELLAPLRELPLRASAEGVRAALGDDDRPKFEGYSKFHVDPRRVQELLMGDQLYRSPGLAIRELYQNALDACRYRKARTEYLATRPGGSPDDWRGRIRFEQGVGPDGRPYLLCEDNGIGMGETELTHVFARAGTRFTDLTDVRNERAVWEAAGIQMHPVSRFGIGVLSYFMIADEIEVVTRRLGEDGATSEPCFKVAIHGPNHLFRVERSTERRHPGTTVRLYLREGAPSCVTELTRLLGVAEFETAVEHGARSATWTAGEYRLRQGSGTAGTVAVHAGGRLVPGPGGEGGGVPDVVWCERGGGLLVDGIVIEPTRWTGVLAARELEEPLGWDAPHTSLVGALVNLTGHRVPKLSVDRLHILSDVADDVEELLRTAVDELIASPSGLLGYDWICHVAQTHSKVADIVAEAAMAADVELRLPDGRTFRPAEVGCLPQEEALLHWSTDVGDPLRWMGTMISPRSNTDHILLWRRLAHRSVAQLAALVPELDEVGPLLRARPSDAVLLSLSSEELAQPAAILETAASIGGSPRATVVRLGELGLGALEAERYPDGDPDPVDVTLLGRVSHDPSEPGGRRDDRLSTARPVPMECFLDAYVEQGLAFSETAERLAGYGFDVSPAGSFPSRPEKVDLRLLSTDCRGEGGWLPGDREVAPGHVLWSAQVTGLSVRDVSQRLGAYGLSVTELPDRPGAEDVRLLSRGLDGRPGWWAAGEVVSYSQVVRAAGTCRLAVTDVISVLESYGLRTGGPSSVDPDPPVRNEGQGVAERLRDLGVVCPPGLPEEPTGLDDLLLQARLPVWAGRRRSTKDVDLFLLLNTAHAVARPAVEVAVRLGAYGLNVPPPRVCRLLDLHGLGASLQMLWVDLGVYGRQIVPGFPVPLGHLCAVSAALDIGIEEVAARLRDLGIDVPEVTESIRAAMARLPRPRS
ncbi:hypothetical protein [Streptomyces sp. NPDC012510]|uniref:wHTH domain-containing protein n=1 Tax=Streptomyces sp. NPDC012510 TaxID=3364838 RepID=UPI0036E9CA8B